MGVGALPEIAAGLLGAGMGAGTPVAIIERGSTPDQRTTIGRLDDIVKSAAAAGVQSPAVIVIGAVADPAVTRRLQAGAEDGPDPGEGLLS
jgi:siroheme synthase